ncbi:unnamed protein product [Rotaria sp. Silwood2]|nr:unnamed protein product [Rotaria sp. Silwood2]CAF3109521.1 unnamed protein product [Rotaria sp. Silwood2]CAF3314886.1 unnamed protein product [Rotaria sp. Silwood2]CAF4330632.1 unnamed protein product [Rotaria sp. Silwood2]CAF4414039.1 unnamed protein product [Rotaria sp. Silwood2]
MAKPSQYIAYLPPAQPIDLSTFKGFKFVTLDGLVIETRDIDDDVSGTFEWEMCAGQEDRCMQFIQEKCVNKRTFLITSGGLGKNVVPKIHDLPQLYAIYVYCQDIVGHQQWASKFSKVRIVCSDDRVLHPQLAVDVAQANIDWGDALLNAGKRDEARAKFQKALDNLTKHAKFSDQAFINQVQKKLAECN